MEPQRTWRRAAGLLLLLCLARDAAQLLPIPESTGSAAQTVKALTSEPWYALLFIEEKGTTNEYVCGGALIHPEWVVTAGHCVYPRGTLSTKATVYLHQSAKATSASTYMISPSYEAETLIPHPVFNIRTLDNDIALIHLPTAVPPSIDPLRFSWDKTDWDALLEQNVLDNAMATVQGYGKNSTGGLGVMRTVKLSPRLTNWDKSCPMWSAAVTHGDLCAGGEDLVNEVVQQPCAGDSGSPIFWDAADSAVNWKAMRPAWMDGLSGKALAYGLTSRGNGLCGQVKGAAPTIFTAMFRFGTFVAANVPAPTDGRAWPPSQPPGTGQPTLPTKPFLSRGGRVRVAVALLVFTFVV